MKSKKVSLSNIIYGIAIVALITMVVIPEAKALMLRGLMKIGLFQPNVSAEKTSPLVKANELSELRFKDSSGNVIALADLKGKVVFLNFWATWCPPCLAEMPSVDELHRQFQNKGEVVFIMVDADNDLTKASHFMQEKGFTLPVHGQASAIPASIFEGSLPTTLLINKIGDVVFKHTGTANYASDRMRTYITELSKQ